MLAETAKSEKRPESTNALQALLRILESEARMTTERVRILDFLHEAATSVGEIVLIECGVVTTLSKVIGSQDHTIALRSLELVHFLVSASLDIVDEFLKHDILNQLVMMQGRNAEISEASFDIVFEILAARPSIDEQMICTSISLMVNLIKKQADHGVLTRLIASIVFIFHTGGDVGRLIAASDMPAAMCNLVVHDDPEVASAAMGLLNSISRDFPEVCETLVDEGVHKHLDRFLCDEDKNLERRASALLSNLLAHKSSKRLL